jgi:hypothetical protein
MVKQPATAFLHLADKLAVWSVAAGGVCLGIQGIGQWSWRSFLPFNIIDFFWMLGFALTLALAVARRRAGLGNRFVLAILALAAAFAVSGLVSEDSAGAARDIVRQFLMAASVWTVSQVASRREHRDLILRVFVIGGVVATAVSLVGYLVVAIACGDQQGILPFVFASGHPLFDGWPRLSGTHGHSPQHFGEFLMVLMAMASVPLFAADRLRAILPRSVVVAGLSGLALLLTFSFAWVGAAVALSGLAAARLRSPMGRIVLGIAIAVTVVLATAKMNYGPATGLTDEQALEGLPCETVNPDHQVVAFERDRCLVSVVDWPRRSIETLYAAAKLTAIEAFSRHPVLGVGPGGFERVARDAIRDRFGTERGVYYDTPHSLYLYAVSSGGIVGGLALVFLMGVIFGGRPSRVEGDPRSETTYRAIWWVVVAFLVLGINVDVITYRSFWFLIGLLAAHGAKERSDRIPAL